MRRWRQRPRDRIRCELVKGSFDVVKPQGVFSDFRGIGKESLEIFSSERQAKMQGRIVMKRGAMAPSKRKTERVGKSFKARHLAIADFNLDHLQAGDR